MKRLNRKFLAAMLIALTLAFGMAIIGCDQATGPENQQDSEQPAAEESPGVTYVGATDEGTPVELVIEDGTYAVKVGGEEVSRGTATAAADGAWKLQPEDGEAFTAKADEDGLTIKGPITDDIDGEDLHELYPVAPPSDVEADYRVSLNAPAVHVFSAKAAGYAKADVKALSVIITNTGNKATGKLTIEVSDAVPSGGFTLSAETKASIAAGKKAAFTVKPVLGLEAGIYTAKVTVSGGNGGTSASISAAFNVRFTVNEADGSPSDGDDEDTEDPEDPEDTDPDDEDGDDEDPDDPNGEDEEDPVYGISLSEKGTLIFDDAIFGYKPLAARDVTITNTGDAETGELTIALSGDYKDFFSLGKSKIDNIAAEGEAEFTVVPKGNLAVGTHGATVTVSGGSNIEEQSFGVSFTVKPVPTHGISLSSADTAIGASYTHQFGTVTLPNYTLPDPLSVTVANSGNQPTGGLAIGVTGADFTLSKTAIDSLSVDGEDSFTVVPNGGLSAGTHSATITVSGDNGINATFGVSFEVRVQPVSVSGFSALVTRMAGEAAIAHANYTLTGGAESYTTAITLTTANSPANVVINGGGSVITGNGSGITVGAGVSLTLTNITFTTLPLAVSGGGSLTLETGAVIQSNAGGGVNVGDGFLVMRDGALITNNQGNGAGGVRMNAAASRFTMDGGTISGNLCSEGGGVRIAGGIFTMNGGLVSDNIGGDGFTGGGGVCLYGADTVFNMKGGAISDNGSTYIGGGVSILGNRAKFNMDGGVISGGWIGRSSGGGGAVYAQGFESEINMSGGTISGNTSHYGAGVLLFHHKNITFTMTGGLITGNSATNNGGGVYIQSTCTFNMIGGEITGNTAPYGGGVYRMDATAIFIGDPQIGGDTAPDNGGWIHGNTKPNGTPSDVE